MTDIVIGIVVLLILGSAVLFIYHDKKKGNTRCIGGGCCSGCRSCPSQTVKKEENRKS